MDSKKDMKKVAGSRVLQFLKVLLKWITTVFGSINPLAGSRKRKRDVDEDGDGNKDEEVQPSKLQKVISKNLDESPVQSPVQSPEQSPVEFPAIPSTSTGITHCSSRSPVEFLAITSTSTGITHSSSPSPVEFLATPSTSTGITHSSSPFVQFADVHPVPSTSTGITNQSYLTNQFHEAQSTVIASTPNSITKKTYLTKRVFKDENVPGKGRTQAYPVHVPISLKCHEPQEDSISFLHILMIEPYTLFDINAPSIEVQMEENKTSREFGFILANELPKVNRFEIVDALGKAKISVWSEKRITLTNEEISSIEIFHKYIFENVLKVQVETCYWNPSQSKMPALLVPLEKKNDASYSIDFEFMRDVRKKSTVCRNITEKCVVIKKDETLIPPKYYHVISLQNENNLIEVRTYGIHEKKKQQTEYLDPEMCNIHPFDTEFLIKTLMLPIILYRLYNLLKSNDLRKSLINSIEAVGNWADVNFGAVNETIRKSLQTLGIEYKKPELPSNDIIKFQGKIITFSNKTRTQNLNPCPFSILTSLTLACAQDEIDLERTEFLGDSYLQYVISTKLYFENPHLDKAALDTLRIEIVKNLNLLEKAQSQKIGNFLITNCFCANKWIPPSYVDLIDTTQMQIIADKCIADCVESLIGIHLLVGGQVAALNFIYKIGIETSPHKMRIENFPPIDVENMTIVDISFRHLLQDTENKIKYKFNKKQLLLKALTHHSFKNNSNDCNQRLVYLGEALYQYFITRTIFENQKLSPYNLTEMRKPLLHKNFLGCIAIKLNLHKKILTRNHPYLNNFLQTCDANEEINYFKAHGTFSGQGHVVHLDVPKCLKELLLAVIAAIYIDARSLDRVWSILHPMLEPSLSVTT